MPARRVPPHGGGLHRPRWRLRPSSSKAGREHLGSSAATETLVTVAKPMLHVVAAPTRVWFSLLLCCLAALFARSAAAQCATQWLPGDGVPGTNGGISAMVPWDPDGPGPLPPVVVVGGGFTVAGAVPTNSIAQYDPVSGVWSALGSGVDYRVFALTTLPNGDLVAGGTSARRAVWPPTTSRAGTAPVGRRWARG